MHARSESRVNLPADSLMLDESFDNAIEVCSLQIPQHGANTQQNARRNAWRSAQKTLCDL
jgi:hypothetical protein